MFDNLEEIIGRDVVPFSDDVRHRPVCAKYSVLLLVIATSIFFSCFCIAHVIPQIQVGLR